MSQKIRGCYVITLFGVVRAVYDVTKHPNVIYMAESCPFGSCEYSNFTCNYCPLLNIV